MENTELFYFTTGDFKPKMELLEESWNHNYFYFLARYFFHLQKIEEYRFTIDSFLSAGNTSWFDTKKLPEILQKWCVQESPFLSFEINTETDVPEITLKNIGLLKNEESRTIAIPIEVCEMVKCLWDFKYFCSVVQNCENGVWRTE